ncbi:MAG: hypothetical protein QM706_08130 [Nitrospira sp.]
MPDYKRRKIELTPRRQGDGTWCCPYRIIEFRPTSWGYQTGSPDGIFASREAAAAAALEKAKRIVDELEHPGHGSRVESKALFGSYRNRISRLFARSPK